MSSTPREMENQRKAITSLGRLVLKRRSKLEILSVKFINMFSGGQGNSKLI